MKNNPSQRKWFHKQKCHLINFQRKTQVQIISRTKIPLIQEVQQVAFDVDQTPHLHANSLCSTHISKHTGSILSAHQRFNSTKQPPQPNIRSHQAN